MRLGVARNEFDVRSVLHGQVSLPAVNQIRVIREAMNGCKNLKIHLRIASKMLILLSTLHMQSLCQI